MTPLINTAQPNPAPIGVPGVAQAGNALSPQGTMQAAPMQQTPTAAPTAPMGAAGTVAPPSGSPAPQGDVGGFIQQARAQGVPDEQIFNHLHENGMIPTNAIVQRDGSGFLGGVSKFAQSIAAPFTSMIGSGVRAIESIPTGLKAVGPILKGTFSSNQDVRNEELNKGNQYLNQAQDIMAKPTLGQNTMAGMSNEQLLGTAAQAGSFLVPGGSGAGARILQGVGMGALQGAGSAASQDASLGDVAKSGAIGAVAGGAISGAVEGVTALAKAGLPKVAEMLEKSNLRLTPTQERDYAANLNNIVKYNIDNIPVGSPASRVAAGADNVQLLEDKFQGWLDSAPVQNITANKQDIIDAAENLKSTFGKERDALEMEKQIDGFKNLIESKYPDSIPLTDINTLKRSTMSGAFNQAGTKVSSDVEYALGNMLYKGIQNLTEGNPILDKYPIAQFNKAYQTAIQSTKLLEAAVGRKQTGFVSRLLLDAIGFSSGGPFGAMGAHVASDYAPVTATKAAASKVASGIASKVGTPTASGVVGGIVGGKAAASGAKPVPKVKVPKKGS